MSLRICVLASGSSGNSTYVASSETQILIDAGLSAKELGRRLSLIGADPSRIRAICITHEHEDHVSAIGVLQRKQGVQLYANSGTIEGIEAREKIAGLRWNVFSTGQAFEIDNLTLEPFSVPHDSYDPVGFVISSGTDRIAIVTDIGMHTVLVREKLKGCSVVVIEANHDESLLKESKRPWSLKQRIAGIQGHLANKQAAELIAGIASPQLKTVFLAHLSAECNKPELAVDTMRKALVEKGFASVDVKLTYNDRPGDVVELV
jgi:phosphoribosyl 1,2-cyclic phosphodiesterase